MSLASNLQSAMTRIGTEFKAIRTLISGSGTGDVSGLDTTATNLVDAINEVLDAAGSGGSPASETAAGIAELATQAETNTGTDDARIVTPLKFATRLAAYAQPLDADLTALAALTTTSYGRALLELANQAALLGLFPAASETTASVIELATQGETNTGTDDARAVTPLKLQTRLAAYAQPLDSDLTAVAALTTTSYGRAFLELANQAALMGLLSSASATAQGIVELATDAETITGTDTARATTPANLAALFTDRIDTNTSLGTSNTKVPSQNAVKTYADALIGAANAVVFKGVIDASSNPNYPAANAGDLYRISVAGKIGGASGPNVEAGDTILALSDGLSAGNHATVGASWNISQANIDGAVVGPASAVDDNFATFDGTTGKLVQDSGLALSTSTSLGTSDTLIPSQNAVKTYADTKQALDATLTALAGVTVAADKVIYATGADAFATTDLPSFGRTLIANANAADARTDLDVYSTTQIGDPATDFVATFEAALT